ncbi:MAG: hypothetical protein N2692_01640 [Patescibacteria group bacterium]|jgi:cell division septal protein FtsQ|nr:hypothetical protein [Patescibacteria group bacterium]
MHARSINTYRLRQIQKRRQKKRRLLMTFLILIVFFGIFISILYSKIFLFQRLIIAGNNLVSISDVYRKIQEINNNRKLFYLFDLSGNILFWSDDLCNKIKETSPTIESVNCQKDFVSKTLKISLKERTPLFLFYDEISNQYFYADKDGILFYQINRNDKENLILIYNKGNNIYHLGDKLAIDLKQIFDLTQIINKKFNFKNFELTNQDIIVVCDGGFKILINLNKLSETTKFVPKLLESNFDFGNLEYLDLRFLPKIYYK